MTEAEAIAKLEQILTDAIAAVRAVALECPTLKTTARFVADDLGDAYAKWLDTEDEDDEDEEA